VAQVLSNTILPSKKFYKNFYIKIKQTFGEQNVSRVLLCVKACNQQKEFCSISCGGISVD